MRTLLEDRRGGRGVWRRHDRAQGQGGIERQAGEATPSHATAPALSSTATTASANKGRHSRRTAPHRESKAASTSTGAMNSASAVCGSSRSAARREPGPTRRRPRRAWSDRDERRRDTCRSRMATARSARRLSKKVTGAPDPTGRGLTYRRHGALPQSGRAVPTIQSGVSCDRLVRLLRDRFALTETNNASRPPHHENEDGRRRPRTRRHQGGEACGVGRDLTHGHLRPPQGCRG